MTAILVNDEGPEGSEYQSVYLWFDEHDLGHMRTALASLEEKVAQGDKQPILASSISVIRSAIAVAEHEHQEREARGPHTARPASSRHAA